MRTLRIGAGAGFADDRIDPAVDLAERGRLDYLVFECLAERSIAVAQRDRLQDPRAGYNEWLEERMRAVLEPARRNGTRIVTNMGAANPEEAAHHTVRIAHELGLHGLTVAVVTGDDVLHHVRSDDYELLERPGRASELGDSILSANAYLGAEGICDALKEGADVVITGRVADPSLFLAPILQEFEWRHDEWDLLARGTAAGHLLECAAQVTGGYFADPGRKDVPRLEALGFPIAEVGSDGSLTITKLPGTGGMVSTQTVAEQLLYEVHDPSRYVTPDVVADFSDATLTQTAPDRVQVEGIKGTARPTSLKVSVGYRDSYIGEGQISYSGLNALARARKAIDILRHRMDVIGLADNEATYDLMGIDSVRRGPTDQHFAEPAEVRVRLAVRTATLEDARRAGREVTALWLNGPAGGGGAWRSAEEDIGIVSVLIPRDKPESHVEVLRVP